jgi:hypothetical protein
MSFVRRDLFRFKFEVYLLLDPFFDTLSIESLTDTGRDFTVIRDLKDAE